MSKQKTVIITGAGSGIGKATAMRFAKDGFNVVLNGRTKDKLERVAEAINKEFDQIETLIVSGDISDKSDVDNIINSAAEKFNGIDVLVNNAAIFVGGSIDDVSLEDWNKQLSINVTGPYMMIKKALPYLEKSKGSIINLCSVSGLGGDWNAFAYNTTKGAIQLMTKSLALDFASKNIRINAVAPSLTDTDMGEGAMENDEKYAQFKERIAMGRAGKPKEVADVIAFLASEEARFVTGTILPVDGGLSASNGQPRL